MMVTSENPRVESGCSIVSGSMSGEHDIADVVNSDSSNGMEADPTKLKDKTGDESNSSGKRRGRVKLKKLPLSICHTRDQENNKGEGIAKISESRLPEENVSRHGNNVKPLPRPESSNDDIIPIVSGPSWNCKDLKAPERSKQNKAVSS
ncbi:PREDICTED: uncharacterized protein LOC104804296 [Tarenaya hassleriana]|uniref:uncharacterized protein LOC104804296 n=1 Tax=Tarenaya hassleriana TaxID=28532 RepID=UPI00053C63AB|nr:PREDICTED: uncharacterized protein LOC104804296 [Tarenaya hassleriana]